MAGSPNVIHGRDRATRRRSQMKPMPQRATRSPAPIMTLSTASPANAMPDPPLQTAGGRAVSVVHVVAELAPFARSGGLGEAVNSLARFQTEAGIKTSIVMPLYDAVRAVATDIEPVG